MRISLSLIDYALIFIYFAFVIGVGWALKRSMKGSTDFFLSGRSIPAWVDPPVPTALMGEIKRRFDPNRTLNPGRFVGGI